MMPAFKPGQSGNPSGRPRLDPEVRAQFMANGARAAEIMTQILHDSEAWGKDGWIPPKDQITLLEKVTDRAYGKSETLSISHSHSHSGQVEHKATPSRPSLRAVNDKLPEKNNQASAQVIDGKATEVKK